MPFRLKFFFLLLWVLGCHDKRTDISNKVELIRSLMAQANDEKQTLPARLSSSLKAYSLAGEQHNIKAQVKAERLSGVLYWQMDSTDQAMTSFRDLVKKAENVSDKESLGAALNNIGLLFSERSVHDSAASYYVMAGKIFSQLKDTFRLVQCDINMGIAYKNIGAYEKAFSITTDAARIMETMNGSAELATAYTTLGNSLKDLRRPEEALAYHRRAMTIRLKLGDSSGVAGSYNNIGNIYRSTKQYSLALEYYLRSLDLKKKFGSQKSKVTTFNNIADAYLGLKQYELAEQYEKEALALRKQADDKDGWMTSANRLAKIYIARNQMDKAKALAFQISEIAKSPIHLRHQLDNALLYQEIFMRTKDYYNAALSASNALSLKDSLFSSDMSAAISTMNVRFQTEQKQKKLELADKNDIIQVQQINKQKYVIILMIVIISLLLVITYLLHHSNKIKKKARDRIELLMWELSHRLKNNLQIISDIFNLQTSITNHPNEIKIIEAGRSRIQAIGIVHNLLYQKEYTGAIHMGEFISEITRNLSRAFQNNSQSAETLLSIENISLHADQAIPLGLIANELLTNIYKYSQVDIGSLILKVAMTADKGKYNLCISDNGLTWDVDAARRQKKGLGLLLINMLAQQLKASWQSYRKESENVHCFSFDIA